MTFSSLVLDVFEPVGDQTERRSRGTGTLVLSKRVWEGFYKQIRICLLLSLSSSNFGVRSAMSNFSNSGMNLYGDLTVAKINSGDISIFRILAEDTLCFAELPEHVSTFLCLPVQTELIFNIYC